MCILGACDLTRGVLSVRYQSGINQNLYENDYDYFVFIIVLFLSITVSLVTSLTSFHSFMVKQELIVNKSIVGSLGFYMVSP